MDQIELLIDNLASKLWGNWLIYVLMGIGVYFTFVTRFIQIRKFPYVIKAFFSAFTKKNENKKNTVSPIQALLTAIGSCVGSGNIVGVSTAIISGGAGALFWMWVAAFFGMATKFSEIALGIKYRTKDEDGQYFGGPMFYISKAFHSKKMGILVAILLFTQNAGGTLIQSNTIVNVVTSSFNIKPIIVGIILAIVIFTIIFGGIHRLVKVIVRLVPFMAVLYLLGGLLIILVNINNLPRVFTQIISQAFSFKAGLGAVAGLGIKEAMRFGIARGLYSNEAGEGSAAVLHSTSSSTYPMEQGLFGIIEVFIDTFIICTTTGLAILCSNVNLVEVNAATLATSSFATLFPSFGYVVNISLILFCVTSLMSQWYFGHVCILYLNCSKLKNIYKMIFCIVILIGSISSIKLVWSIQDCALGLLIIPNLIALFILSKEIRSIIKENT